MMLQEESVQKQKGHRNKVKDSMVKIHREQRKEICKGGEKKGGME